MVLVGEQIRAGISVKVIPLKGTLELEEAFAELGAEVILDLFSLNPIRQVLRLRKILKSNDSIIHAHLPRAELISAFSRSNMPLFFSRHNAEPFFPGAPKLISNLLSRIVCTRAKSGIAISKAVHDFVLQRGEVEIDFPLHTIHYGFNERIVSATRDASSSIPGLEPDSYVIGTVARIVHQKDIPTLLKSFRAILSFEPRAKLVVLGDGPLMGEMRSLSEQLLLSDAVIWLGRKDNVIQYLKQFDVFILTSKYEGFGLVLLEAMQAQVPVIASRNSAIPEVLGEDFPGLVGTGDADAFASAALSLSDNDLKEHFVNLQNSQLALFAPAIMERRINAVYELYS